ncbi:unnamed protein product, partial [Musa textilis]
RVTTPPFVTVLRLDSRGFIRVQQHAVDQSMRAFLGLMDADPSEYANYWEIKCFLEAEELCSLGFDETLSGYCNSSSPDMAAQSAPPNSIIKERERRKRLNRTLYNLRSVVPNVTKVKSTAAMSLQLMHLILVFGLQMSKAAILFDAINYIQQLQGQERSLLEEISEQESHRKRVAPVGAELCHAQAKKRRTAPRSSCSAESELPMMPSVEAMEVSVRELGNGISVISITCSKKRHVMVRVCEVVESLDLRIISAGVASRSGIVFHTLMVEVDAGQSAHLKEKIEATFVHLMPQETTASFREAEPNIARPRTPMFYA